MVKSISTVTVAASDWEIYDPENTLRTEDDICITTEDGNYIGVDDSIYTWSAEIAPTGVTADSKVDIQMTTDLVAAGIQDEVFAFMAINEDGTVTLLCTGMKKPTVSIDFSCIVYPVNAA